MKLRLTGTDFSAKEWKRENRARGVYPPPNDGREWILLDEAAALFGIKPKSMRDRAATIGFTRTCRRGVKPWLLKKEVTDYLAFLKDRERWYKRRRPQHWEPMIAMNAGEDEADFRRIYWTAKQAAAFMGVSRNTIYQWTKMGKIPVFLTRAMGRGRNYWYSPTSLRNLKEDEQWQQHHARYEKGTDTMRRGLSWRETYNTRHKPRSYPTVPKEWLTVREVAERLQISVKSVHRLRKMERFLAKQWVGAWDRKNRPWFIHEDSVERFKNDEYYQITRQRGLSAIQSRLGNPTGTAKDDILPQQPSSSDLTGLTFGYTPAELRLPRERIVPFDGQW